MSTKNQRGYQSSFHIIQDARSQIREIIRNEMRDNSLRFIYEIFQQEMDSLCGPSFSRKGEGHCHRGGSDPGSILLEGQRVAVKKPRLKRAGKEVELQSYQALQGFDLLQEKVLKHMVAGVSTRDYEGLLSEVSGGLGLKKSSVSKAFAMGSREAFDRINTRDLSEYTWAAVMVDGIEFGGSCVISALGITNEGKKLILGLKRGDTENAEVCKDFFQELIARGLKSSEPFLFVLDGSKALKSAVIKVFGEHFPIQRCVRHKERNILKYLQKQYHAEFRRRWKLLHGITSYDEAKLEYDRLLFWLSQKNQAAGASLEEADMETLTVIRLKARTALRKTLLSTNPIESAFGKVRAKTARVKRWRKNGDQIERWSSACLLEAEKGFRAIRGVKDLADFMLQLKTFGLPTQQKAA
jgi:putative transposase